MKEKLIEIRQQLSNKIVDNGAYEITIPSIQIKEGDTIQIKNVFIDTRNTASQNTINIPEDLTVSLSVIKYVVDWFKAPTSGTDQRNYFGSTEPIHPRGVRYLLCKESGALQIDKVTQIYFLSSNKRFPYAGEQLRSEDYIFEYKDASDFTKTFTISVSKDKAQDVIDDNLDKDYGIFIWDLTDGGQGDKVMKPGSLILKSPTMNGKNGAVARQRLFWDKDGFQKSYPDAPQDKSYNDEIIDITTGFNPYIETVDFVVSAGSYTATDIATLVSKNLSVTTDGKVDIDKNKILTRCGVFNRLNNYGYCSEDGQDFFTVEDDNQMWLGSNEIALEYDEQKNKFEWTYLHFPYYSRIQDNPPNGPTNGAIVNTVINVPANPPINNDAFDLIIGASAGICITAWTSAFFEDILGFDDTIYVDVKDYIVKNINGQDTHIPVFNTVDGVNTTTAYAGLDNLVQKTNFNWFRIPTTLTNLENTSDITTSIIAPRVIEPQEEETFSHYQVLVECGFDNDYINNQMNRRNLNAIVSKYYSYDSYTIYQDSSTIYEHKGQTNLLNNIRVKILDSEFNTPEIGIDNTIILLLTQND